MPTKTGDKTQYASDPGTPGCRDAHPNRLATLCSALANRIIKFLKFAIGLTVLLLAIYHATEIRGFVSRLCSSAASIGNQSSIHENTQNYENQLDRITK